VIIDQVDCSSDLSAGVQVPVKSMERSIAVKHHVQAMMYGVCIVDLELIVSRMFQLNEAAIDESSFCDSV
jgi:hypothetical protein